MAIYYTENGEYPSNEYLEEKFGKDYKNLLAKPVEDGDYFNFITNLSGEFEFLNEKNNENIYSVIISKR